MIAVRPSGEGVEVTQSRRRGKKVVRSKSYFRLLRKRGAIQLHDLGWTHAEIADFIGVDRSTVSYLLSPANSLRSLLRGGEE